jgi:hypothetical protein
LGDDPATIPVYEWYDDDIHLLIHEEFMKSPEFEKLDPQIKNAFVMHRMAHQFNQQQKMAKQVAQAATMQNMLGGGGPGGSPGGGGQSPPSRGDNANGGGSPPLRPGPPNAPNGPIPGGVMPTALPTPASA